MATMASTITSSRRLMPFISFLRRMLSIHINTAAPPLSANYGLLLDVLFPCSTAAMRPQSQMPLAQPLQMPLACANKSVLRVPAIHAREYCPPVQSGARTAVRRHLRHERLVFHRLYWRRCASEG